jgi:hypothetical protein
VTITTTHPWQVGLCTFVAQKELLYHPDMITLSWRPFKPQTIFFHTKSLQRLESVNGWPAPLFVLVLQATVMCFCRLLQRSQHKHQGTVAPTTKQRCTVQGCVAVNTLLLHYQPIKFPRKVSRNNRQLDNRSETTVKHLKQLRRKIVKNLRQLLKNIKEFIHVYTSNGKIQVWGTYTAMSEHLYVGFSSKQQPC